MANRLNETVFGSQPGCTALRHSLLVAVFLVRPLALFYGFLLWSFVIALPNMASEAIRNHPSETPVSITYLTIISYKLRLTVSL